MRLPPEEIERRRLVSQRARALKWVCLRLAIADCRERRVRVRRSFAKWRKAQRAWRRAQLGKGPEPKR